MYFLILKDSVIHAIPPRVIPLEEALTSSTNVVEVLVDAISSFLTSTENQEGSAPVKQHGKRSKAMSSHAKYSPNEKPVMRTALEKKK
ncbi:hypothetical protein HMI56_005293 [Coelomomyces lativittatus]|nr:hypothetical protein HMI56_005293 [Coelomomyces lativittatus]